MPSSPNLNTPRIDATDVQILKILLEESRTSFTKISKECNITVAAVRKRYKRLWKAGIINGEMMQLNPYSLGYKCVTDIGIMTAIENEREIFDFLLTMPFIVGIHPRGFGKYNMGATIALRDIEKLSGVIERLESNPYIKRVDTLIWAETKNIDHGENIVIQPTKGQYEPTTKQRNQLTTQDQVADLDDVDKQILKILTRESRTPFSTIAEQIGVSTVNVIQRYKKLRENVLTLSSVTVDLRMFGYKALAHLFLKAKDRSKMSQIYAQLLDIPNMLVVIRLIGPYDIRALVAIADFQDIFELTDKIRRIQGVEQPEVYMCPIFFMWPLNVFAPLLEPNLQIKFLASMRPFFDDKIAKK
jgi:Lrp/AsnC family transcriptional regulator, regulator for asnA, asnC and gidA